MPAPATHRPSGSGRPAPRPLRGDRFSARARRRRLLRLLWALVAALVVAIVASAVWLVGWSDVLALERVRIEGVQGRLITQVEDAAATPLGTPLVQVDTAAVADRVAELPEVAEVAVQRSWPRSLVVEVTPRVPAAAVNAGERWWRVDRDGVIFGESGSRPEGLPVLDAPVGSGSQPARAAGVAVVTGLPAELRERVETIAAPTEASVELTLTDGATVVWGTAQETQRKAEVLLALLDRRSAADVSAYDVSAPDHPALDP